MRITKRKGPAPGEGAGGRPPGSKDKTPRIRSLTSEKRHLAFELFALGKKDADIARELAPLSRTRVGKFRQEWTALSAGKQK